MSTGFSAKHSSEFHEPTLPHMSSKKLRGKKGALKIFSQSETTASGVHQWNYSKQYCQEANGSLAM